jgi:radical SAM protein with 4Fe4S-binding SPASM domain
MFGGDALLRKDILIPLIRHVKEKGIPRCSLPTNGNLLDKEAASGLVEAGLDIVEVSIDSVSHVHNKMRGVDKTFERAEDAILALLKARGDSHLPRIQVNCTVSKMNVQTFEKLLPFAEKIGADIIAFEYVGEFPPSSVNTSDINGNRPSPFFVAESGSNLLNEAEAQVLKSKISRIKRDSKKLQIRCVTGNIDVLNTESLVTGKFPHKKCYMSHSLIILDPFGNLLACPFFDSYVIGNIRKRRFSDIWNNEKHRLFADTVNSRLRRPELCHYCILSVERNPSFFTSIRKLFYKNRK